MQWGFFYYYYYWACPIILWVLCTYIYPNHFVSIWEKGFYCTFGFTNGSTWGLCVGFNGHNLITTGDSEVGVECLRKLVRGLMHNCVKFIMQSIWFFQINTGFVWVSMGSHHSLLLHKICRKIFICIYYGKKSSMWNCLNKNSKKIECNFILELTTLWISKDILRYSKIVFRSIMWNIIHHYVNAYLLSIYKFTTLCMFIRKKTY